MRVILMHGKDTSPDGKWYPWFAREMASRDIIIDIPKLPQPANPALSEWIAVLDRLKPDHNTVLIGHSRGGVAILRWLEKAPAALSVKKVILVATNSGFEKKMDIPGETNLGFYTADGYNFGKIMRHSQHFVVLHSRDDPWVSFEAGVENSRGLNAKFIKLDGYKHFGKGIDEIPQLLEETLET